MVQEETRKMEVVAWIIFGLLVGVVAKFLMPGDDPGGFIVTIAIGVLGALLGGWLGRNLGMYQEGEAAGFIMSVLGSVVLLALYRLVMPRRRRL
jgi:uncharacterized membrane protein YeaQ/YmgE (transglycosylase-associated protein family)